MDAETTEPASNESKKGKLKESKEAFQKEEKEQDSTLGEGNVNTNADTESVSSVKDKKAKGKGKPGKDKIKEEQDEKSNKLDSLVPEEKPEALPENVFPLFMTSKSQEIYKCKCDEDVTQENPFKFIPKTDIVEDFRMRAAVCDFHPFKQQILDYPGDDILIMYDYEFKHGQNFIIALTEEAKELLLKSPEQEGSEEGGDGEEDEEGVMLYVPPEPKEWVSQGSELEIQESSVIEKRRKIKVSVKRIRSEFGAPVTFSDRNVGDVKDGAVDCLAYEDKNFDIQRMELDKAVQAVSMKVSEGTQTTWKFPRNANTQTCPREFTLEEQETYFHSTECLQFVNNVAFYFHQALQQNEIMNVFCIDWMNLGDSDDALGTKADNHLKEYQSFTDLQFSKDKIITCIQWHPVIKGVVATSVADKMTFDERIDNAAKVIMTPSLILIWSFADPIHPQLILEAPDDIHSFDFNPSDANHIAGGCCNGQIVLWDITAHADRLKQQKGTQKNKKRTELPGFEDANALKTPILRYCAVSSIEHSHKASVTNIQWLPDHMQVTKMGVPQENPTLYCNQLITCATDCVIYFWDTKPPKIHQLPEEKSKHPMGIPDTFRYLDLTWKPLFRVSLIKSEPGGDHAPITFSIQEKQGDRSSLSGGTDQKEGDTKGAKGRGGGGGDIPKPGSGKERTLTGVKTFMFVGTEDGDVLYVDWMPQKDQDSGKVQTPKPVFYYSTHDGPVVSLQRSPFFKDILLSVGGWTISIWKEDVNSGPILSTAACSVRLTCGIWSPTRPGVFFIAKVDGSVDVWDLLDKTHEPTLTQNVAPAAITQIFPYQVAQKQQLIAVGDNQGTLHILEIPWSLRQPTPSEANGVGNYLEREVKRRAFVMERWEFREQEKRELEAEAKKRAGGFAATMAPPTDDEQEARAKQEYDAYLTDEHILMRELGLLQEEDGTSEAN